MGYKKHSIISTNIDNDDNNNYNNNTNNNESLRVLIIPAIATTNAIIAGLIVMEGLKVLSGHLDKCKTVSSYNIIMCYFYVRLQ